MIEYILTETIGEPGKRSTVDWYNKNWGRISLGQKETDTDIQVVLDLK